MTFEDFATDPETRWTYVADRVMGGVSDGQAQVAEGAIRLTGAVSTDNNGGFIQVRNRFGGGWDADTQGLRISARGNGEQYWVFLRTEGLARVWYSYRFPFTAGADWSDTQMPFAEFKPSHSGMPDSFAPGDVISIGIVAYGKDFEADVSVRQIDLY